MKLIKILVIIIITANFAYGQEKGEPEPEFNPDTTFVFNSPRPLITPQLDEESAPNALGFDLLFSDSGFGVGMFYRRNLAKDFSGFVNLYISGYRNSDEFERYDPVLNQYIVPNKIRRLFIFPLMFGMQKNFFSDEIHKNLRPFLTGGFGPTLIMETPYPKEFFSAFGDAKVHTRMGGFIGFGANFGSSNTTLMGVNVRYYYIPFSSTGIESVKGLPIKDFKGVFLSLSIGTRM